MASSFAAFLDPHWRMESSFHMTEEGDVSNDYPDRGNSESPCSRDDAPLIEGSDEGDNEKESESPTTHLDHSFKTQVSPSMMRYEREMKDISPDRPTTSVRDVENQSPAPIDRRDSSSVLGSTTPDLFANIVADKIDFKNYIGENSLFYKAFADIAMRLKYFVYLLGVIFIVLLAEGNLDTSTFLSLTFSDWVKFLTASMGTTAVFNVLGHGILNGLEAVWMGDYGFIFCLSALHGPFVYLGSIISIAKFNAELQMPGKIKTTDKLFVVLVWIILFTATKKYHVKKYYLQLLEKRLEGKLKEIEAWQVILSSLSSVRKPTMHISDSGASLSQLSSEKKSNSKFIRNLIIHPAKVVCDTVN